MKQYSDTVIDFIWFCIHELGDDAADIKKTLGCSIAQALQVFRQAHAAHNPFYNPNIKCLQVSRYKPPITYRRPPPTFSQPLPLATQPLVRPKAQYSNPQFNQL